MALKWMKFLQWEESQWIHSSEKLLLSLYIVPTHQQPIIHVYTPCQKGEITNDLGSVKRSNLVLVCATAAMWWV